MKNLSLLFLVFLVAFSASARPPKITFKLGVCNFERTESYGDFQVTIYADGKLVADNFTSKKRNKLKLWGSHYYTIVIKKEGFQDYYLCYDARDTVAKDKTRLDFSTSMFPVQGECSQSQVIEFHTKSNMISLAPEAVKNSISIN